MLNQVRPSRRKRRKANPNSRGRFSVQKPNGIIGPRVQKVGGERFAIVCVDPAKHCSEWMMADYFGNLLIKPQTLQTGLDLDVFTRRRLQVRIPCRPLSS